MKHLLARRFLPLSASEYAIYHTYDRQRRQRLLQVLLPTATGLFGLTSLIYTARFPILIPLRWTTWVLYGAILLMTFAFFLGTLAIRHERIGLATSIMVLTGSLGVLFIFLFQVFFQEGLDTFTISEFLLFGSVVVLAGVLGNLWTVIGAALLVNAVTVFTLWLAPHSASREQFSLQPLLSIALAVLILEWLIAAILIANWLTYRQTLRTLGAAYERIAQAEQLDALKDQFISHINHELRTPIMTQQAYVEYLRRSQQQMTDDERALLLEKASRNMTALVTLLSSILEVRRIDGKTDTFVPEVVPVRAALETALLLIDHQQASFGELPIRITLPEGLAIWGEAVRLQQILINLLSNALKYSLPGTPIDVTGRMVSGGATKRRQRKKGSGTTPMVEIQVRDAGFGIPPEQIPLLFNRFVRLPRDLASPVAGSGLGLYLCRILTESMGGTIRVESSGVAGEGSTFFVRLPLPPKAVAGSITSAGALEELRAAPNVGASQEERS